MTEVICSYCGFSINEPLVSRIKGKPYHRQCIDVMVWEEKKEKGRI